MINANGIDLQNLLLPNIELRNIEPHIYSVVPENAPSNSFDDMAAFYDLVICNKYYNRIMWGYNISNYAAITTKALNASKDGWVLDAGCGSLAFTADSYVNYRERPIVLFDQSIKLLKIAKSKIIKLNDSIPSNMIFLQADALKLPFKPAIFSTIISLNLIHVFDDITNVLASFKNVLTENGTMTLSTLIKNGRITDKYLDVMLKKTSGVAPKTYEQLREYFTKSQLPVTYDDHGNMVFITHGFK